MIDAESRAQRRRDGPGASSARLRVRVTARAGRDAIVAWDGGVLQVRVAAPPARGQANRALLRLLGRALRVPRGQITLTHGERHCEKTLAIGGLSAAALRERLATISQPGEPGAAGSAQGSTGSRGAGNFEPS